MNNVKIGFIGIGNMATALINGIIKSNVDPSNIIVFDIDSEKAGPFVEQGAVISESIEALSKKADAIFLTIKPQAFDVVMPQLISDDNKLFISIAAGISIKYIRSFLGKTAQVVRVMPNTPLLIGKGATAISYSSNVDDAHKKITEAIFGNLGVFSILSEDKMNEVIAINGSSPALIYYFADLFIKKAKDMGIENDIAKSLFCNTMIGSAQMILDSSDSPKELIEKVSSKGGTTVQMMEVFYNNNLENIVNTAIDECTKRAYELDKS